MQKRIALIFLLVSFSAIFYAQQPMTTQKLNYIGSSTVGNFIQDAEKHQSDFNFEIDTRPESSGGESAILEGRADIAGIARLPSKELLSSGVTSTLIGWDAIAIIINKTNKVSNLSKEQLAKIYLGEITNWKQLGGDDLAIHPYIVSVESATRKVCRSAILGEKDYQSYEEVSPDIDIISRVQNDPGGIGQISFSFVKENNKIRILQINRQALTLSNKSYPITRPLYLLWWQGRRDVAEFVNWATSISGQKVVTKRFIGIKDAAIKFEAESGELIVYSKTSAVEDGGIYFYPHNPYEVYSSNHDFLRYVPNHLSNNDESPTRIRLPVGDYIIKINPEEKNPSEFRITIASGKLIKLYPERKKSKYKYEPTGNNSISSETKIEQNRGEKYEFFGDFRVRAEEDINQDFERFRGRFRIRAGLNASLNDQVKVSIRMVSTGNPDDPNSSHVNLTKGFNQIKAAFDRAFVYYHPKKFPSIELWLGKFSNPNQSSKIYSEILWDADIQPEGIAFSLKNKPGAKNKLKFINGFYELSQFKSGTNKNWLFTSQLNDRIKLTSHWTLALSSGVYLYKNIKGLNVNSSFIDENDGNIQVENISFTGQDTVVTYHYFSNFLIHNSFINLISTDFDKPLIFKFQWLKNWEADLKQNGYIAGVSYGSLKNQKDWLFYYQFNHLERESIFTPFAQDDALMRTNTSGHIFGIAYNLRKKISVHLWALNNQSLSDNVSKSRFRLDLNVKF